MVCPRCQTVFTKIDNAKQTLTCMKGCGVFSTTVQPLQQPGTRQPDPKPGRTEINPLVIADLQTRYEHGKAKYGQPLMSGNGRDALQDAYEEALDLCLYLKQAIVERNEANADRALKFL